VSNTGFTAVRVTAEDQQRLAELAHESKTDASKVLRALIRVATSKQVERGLKSAQ
jgi:hypothetical protein